MIIEKLLKFFILINFIENEEEKDNRTEKCCKALDYGETLLKPLMRNISIEEGEFVVIRSSSGNGKSTCANLIGSL